MYMSYIATLDQISIWSTHRLEEGHVVTNYKSHFDGKLVSLRVDGLTLDPPPSGVALMVGLFIQVIVVMRNTTTLRKARK
jgi:hypothetical protein